MKIIEAIHAVDSLKPNSYSESDKVRWLSTLDGLIKANIIDTHEGDGRLISPITATTATRYYKDLYYEEGNKIYLCTRDDTGSGTKLHCLPSRLVGECFDDAGGIAFTGYNEETPLDTELIVPAPYDNIYVLWLQSQIDYANEESAKFNNSSSAYNHAYSEFQKYYNRTHIPCSQPRKYF